MIKNCCTIRSFSASPNVFAEIFLISEFFSHFILTQPIFRAIINHINSI